MMKSRIQRMMMSPKMAQEEAESVKAPVSASAEHVEKRQSSLLFESINLFIFLCARSSRFEVESTCESISSSSLWSLKGESTSAEMGRRGSTYIF